MGANGLIATGVPPQPLWLLWIKIAILVLSLIILALAAWVLSLYGGYASYTYSGGSAGFDVFITIWSFLVYGGAAALEIWAPQFFYRIAALIGYILAIIFWLTAWAWSASSASLYLGGGGYHSEPGAGLAACAGLGAVVWILNIVHIVYFIIACVRDTTVAQAELGNVKHEVPPQQYQQPYATATPQQPYQPAPQQYPPQQYPQQPYGQ